MKGFYQIPIISSTGKKWVKLLELFFYKSNPFLIVIVDCILNATLECKWTFAQTIIYPSPEKTLLIVLKQIFTNSQTLANDQYNFRHYLSATIWFHSNRKQVGKTMFYFSYIYMVL